MALECLLVIYGVYDCRKKARCVVCGGSWDRWEANQSDYLCVRIHLSQHSSALHWTHRYVSQEHRCIRTPRPVMLRSLPGGCELCFPEYVVTMFDTKTQELRWNATYNDYSAPPYDEKLDYSTCLTSTTGRGHESMTSLLQWHSRMGWCCQKKSLRSLIGSRPLSHSSTSFHFKVEEEDGSILC